MASNGFVKEPSKGKCRICQRSREVKHVKKVGEVKHGFACGYIWECKDVEGCDKFAAKKLADPKTTSLVLNRISLGIREGRAKGYIFRS